ncbi:MAG: GNAT family N-acetyltransferase, partial [Cyanobacteria bacterium]|nr:GNAT family N-acetyltransferase [Cyanobacteriota bacterium]
GKTDQLLERIAVSADAQELRDLVHLSYRGGKSTVPWKNENEFVDGERISQEELSRLIQSKTARILILETVGRDEATAKIVGCVLIEDGEDAHDAHIGLLTVHPDFQNLGLGKALLAHAEEFARRELDAHTATMWVLSAREGLLQWYVSLGYEETGETEPFPENEETCLYPDPYFRVIRKSL